MEVQIKISDVILDEKKDDNDINTSEIPLLEMVGKEKNKNKRRVKVNDDRSRKERVYVSPTSVNERSQKNSLSPNDETDNSTLRRRSSMSRCGEVWNSFPSQWAKSTKNHCGGLYF